jgi:sigma-54 dependent transcriptional regulator, acetoin dehydrogenase operon transcriptional activator AcoR
MYNKKRQEEIIKKSHERSKEYGIEKERTVSRKILKGRDVSENIRHNRELIRIATPFMKTIYDFLVDSGFIMILTDRKGCILNIFGDKDIVQGAKELNMVVGAYMDESSVGTNAMGTAIKEDAPIQISAKEHFITAYHRWTCSAAPIHNISGEIIGTLNLTGYSDLVHPHTLGLVAAAVKSVENQLKSEVAQSSLMEAYQYNNTIMNSIQSGIIAVDRDGNIKSINDSACIMLKLGRREIINGSIGYFLKSWEDIFRNFEEGKEYQDEEVSFKLAGLKERHSLNAQPIKATDGRVIGMVLTFKELQKVINLVNRYTGMRARYTFEELIGQSREVQAIVEYGKNIAESPSTILIEGESGTGKEVLAQAIHNWSSRKDNGFVAINCGAISKNLIESELFGYDEGAFTGAKKGGHPGKFELANGGTLFLDEIGEMPLDMQVNLLRVLQEGCITRIGGSKYIPVDVRIIAATNKDLRKEVARGTFRQDLYYRLSVIPIVLPPLRERKEDVKLLVEHFLRIKALRLNRSVPLVSDEIWSHVYNYDWPGNIRELENFVEKLVNLEGKMSLNMTGTVESASTAAEATESRETAINFCGGESYNSVRENLSSEEIDLCSLEELEKRAITAALKSFKGNITQISKTLGISRNTLYQKMKKYGL